MQKDIIVEKIENYIRLGEVHDTNLQIGIEIEHYIMDRKTGEFIHYFSPNGIPQILKALGQNDWELHYIDNQLLGASKNDLDITIEPGSQLEVSVKLKENVQDLKRSYDMFLNEIKPIFNELEYTLTYSAYNPVAKIEDIPLLPKKRYEYMFNHFSKTGQHGHNMMKGTAALQISIDYSNEKDFSDKIKAAYWLVPILYATFENVTVYEGEVNTQPAMRAVIWRDTDNARCGIIDKVFETEIFTYKDYAEIIASLPAIFVPTAEGDVYTGNATTAKLIAKDHQLIEKINHFMGMSFFDVRVKQYIEIRPIDGLSPLWSFAITCLIKALLYSSDNLKKIGCIAKATDVKEVKRTMKAITSNGMNIEYCGKPMWDWVSELLTMAKQESEDWEKKQINWLIRQLSTKKTPREMKEEIRKAGIV